jgi:hypothetical protein
VCDRWLLLLLSRDMGCSFLGLSSRDATESSNIHHPDLGWMAV